MKGATGKALTQTGRHKGHHSSTVQPLAPNSAQGQELRWEECPANLRQVQEQRVRPGAEVHQSLLRQGVGSELIARQDGTQKALQGHPQALDPTWSPCLKTSLARKFLLPSNAACKEQLQPGSPRPAVECVIFAAF
jgi:hypothetical protein